MKIIKTRIVVLGGKGRLGSAVAEQAKLDPTIELSALVDRQGSLKNSTREGDVIIDATNAESVESNLRVALGLKTPYVLAATGYDNHAQKKIEEFGKTLPIVVAPNLSVGVAVLHELVELARSFLGDADVELMETHHRNKKDAPSGTALSLSRLFQKKIPIHSLRGGDVVGEHSIQFLMDGERVAISHSATNRTIFAKGALRAAKFVSRARPGVYSMRDVLGLKK